MYVGGVPAAADLAFATHVWHFTHVVIYALLLTYVTPPGPRWLWVADGQFTLWIYVAAVCAEVYYGQRKPMVKGTHILLAVLDVMITAEMDGSYIESSRTAAVLRFALNLAMLCAPAV